MPQRFNPQPDPRAHLKSQPALFDQSQVKPADAHRYQRGYTPERMAETRDVFPGQRSPDGSYGRVPNEVFGPPQLRQHFHEAVARSSMNLEPFRGQVDYVHANYGFPGNDRVGEMTAGLTQTRAMRLKRGGSVAMPGQKVFLNHDSFMPSLEQDRGNPASERELMGGVAIHELGHVHQGLTDPSGFTKGQTGGREHYADRFSEAHFRPDPREVRRGTQADVTRQSYPARGTEVEGYPNFDEIQAAHLKKHYGWSNDPVTAPPVQQSLFHDRRS